MLLLILFCAASISTLQAQNRIYYVKEGGTGQGDSWERAAGNLQAIINKSVAGDVVYVTAGRYYATDGDLVTDERGPGNQQRQRSFVMKAGVSVYGGFNQDSGIAAGETPATRAKVFDARYGWQLAHASVLTGEPKENQTSDNWYFDILNQCWRPSGYPGDNVLHVVWFASNGFKTLVVGEATEAKPLEHETILNGFTIEAGCADGNVLNEQIGDGSIQGHSARFGGGVYLVENGVLQQCMVRENYALTRGGGVFLNSGGRVSDCMVTRNASPGSSVNRNGFGGGIYLLGRGTVERSFVVNNNARIGGGIYCAKDQQPSPYEMKVEMSIVANNTAMHESGGIYCDKGGVLTGLVIAKNYTLSAGIGNLDYGKTGGLYCNEYGVVTNTVLWGNSSSANNRQYYGNNVLAAEGQMLASVQLFYCAIQDESKENFGNATLKGVININNQIAIAQAHFKKDPGIAGIIVEEPYLEKADWDKEECSIFLRNGALDVNAPFLSTEKQVAIPKLSIDGKNVTSRPDIGPYVTENLLVNSSLVNGVWVVFVDNQTTSCGDGSSWKSPVKFLRPAIEHLAAKGGGQVWVKEGVYRPVSAAFGAVDPKTYCVEMMSGVDMYGGFPQEIPSPGMADRNPVHSRTIISADIGLQGEVSDNCYHLVVFDEKVTKRSVLDGFCLMDANASDEEVSHGGGVVVLSPHAVLRNCIIENNISRRGAAIWSNQPFYMENCVINNNEVTEWEAAAIEVASGTSLMNLTVVLNKGIGIRMASGKITNTVVWGNTGNQSLNKSDGVQLLGVPAITFSAISNMIHGNIFLSEEATGENAPNFVNPTLRAGVITSGGYGTVQGGPAVFEPECISPLINMGTTTGAPAADITGKKRVSFGGTQDIGAYYNTCLPAGESTIRYVKQGARGKGSSWSDASGDLYSMVYSLKETGGEVWVAAGTYTNPYKFDEVNFEMIEGVNVYGGFPNFGTPGMKERRPDSEDPHYRTILQAQATDVDSDCGRVLLQGALFVKPTVWDGFTIQHGSIRISSEADGGAGVKLLKNGRLENCVIRNNRNELTSSTTDIHLRGGGVYNDGGTLVNCYIHDNRIDGQIIKPSKFNSSVYGAGLYMLSGQAYNCVISRNTALSTVGNPNAIANAYGAGVYVADGVFFNNTISGNEANGNAKKNTGTASGMRVIGKALVTNCIVWGNTWVGKTEDQITGEGKATVSYSCVQHGYSGTGNISEDPKFAGADDFRLQAASPVINVGNTYPAGVKLPATDMDYTNRIKDCAVDMGAYEFDNLEVIRPQLADDRAVAYVTRDGAGMADGSSWENAACGEKLQRAIHTVATSGKAIKQVWVGVGMNLIAEDLRSADFYPTVPLDPLLARSYIFQVETGVELIGGFKGNETTPDERILGLASSVVTILNGDIHTTPTNREDDAYHVAVVESDARLESFVVMNGHANHFNDPVYQSGGGLVVRSGGLVRNCYVRDCYAMRYGGGVLLEERGRIVGSVVTESEALLGGGIYAASWAEITGSTIVKNKAEQGGGVYFRHPAAIQSSVLWGNTGNNGKNIFGNTELPYEPKNSAIALTSLYYPVNYSAIEGFKVEGVENIALSEANDAGSDSPDFIDPENATYQNGGWGLKSSSTLIDKGINTTITSIGSVEDIFRIFNLSKWDLAGKKRILTVHAGYTGNYMDIGAYESDQMIVLNPADVDGKKRIYVTYTSRGKMDGSSWSNGMSDLQAALNYFRDAGMKGEIWVQGGYSYVPSRRIDAGHPDPRSISFVLNRYVDLYGGFKGDSEGAGSETTLEERVRYDRNQNGIIEEFEYRYATTLDGMINPVGMDKNTYHVLYYNDATATDTIVLNGFSVIHGYADGEGPHANGGGLFANSPVKVMNCIFRHNLAKTEGGAVWCRNNQMSLQPMILNSSFGGNESRQAGGAISIYNGLILNTNFFNNSATTRGGAIDAENTTLLNSTVARNSAAEGAGVYMENGRMTNSVVWGNGTGSQVSGTVTATWSAVQGAEGITVEKDNYNINLSRDNNASDGPRFFRPTETFATDNYDWTADWSVYSLSVLVDNGNNEAYLPEYPQKLNDLLYTAASDYTPIKRVENGRIDIGSYEYKNFPLKENVNRLYVRTWEGKTEGSDGSSWARATSDLQTAIETLERSTATGIKEIWVAQGEYVPMKIVNGESDLRARSFLVEQGGIQIYGGFPDDATGLNPSMSDRDVRKFRTILNGQKVECYNVLDVKGNQPMLIDGFIIKGGKGGGEMPYGSGAVIENDEVTINHCIFTENGQEGTSGAALYIFGKNLKVENSLFYNNTTCAIWQDDGYSLNNTMVGNARGIYIRSGEMKNCAVWGNAEDQVAIGASYGLPPPVIEYNGIQGGFAGEGNIRLSAQNDSASGPRFINPEGVNGFNFDLDCGSILIDKGTQEVSLTDSLDLITRRRLRGKGIDIGAYESLHGEIPPTPVYTGDTTKCQGMTMQLTIDNSAFPGTDIYWTRGNAPINVEVNKDPVTMTADLPAGRILYRAARVDMTTLCQSEAVLVPVTVFSAEPLTVFGGGGICEGMNAEFSFTPVEGALAYNLYNGTNAVNDFVLGDGTITIPAPAIGQYAYQLTMERQYSDKRCESLRGDSVKITVHPYPVLKNSGEIADVVSGNLIHYLPESNVAEATFTWERPAVEGIEGGTPTGADSIREVLVNRTTEPISVTYLFQVQANGCATPMGFPVVVTVWPGMGMPTIVNAFGQCGTGKVVLQLLPAAGPLPEKYMVYRDGTLMNGVSPGADFYELIVDAPANDYGAHAYRVRAQGKIGEKVYESDLSPAVLVSAHVAMPDLKGSNEYTECFGKNMELRLIPSVSVSGYKLYEDGVGVDTALYTIHEDWMTLLAPMIGTHHYQVSSIRKHTDGVVCESNPKDITVQIQSSSDSIVVTGVSGGPWKQAINSGEYTYMEVHPGDKSQTGPCQWTVKSQGPDVTVVSGNTVGNIIYMNLVNLGFGPQQVVFLVRYPYPAGSRECEPTREVTVTVHPLKDMSLETEGTDRQVLCEGDRMVDIVYIVMGEESAMVTGLPDGVTYRMEPGRIVISGIPLVSASYTVATPSGQRAAGTITVHPKPVFELGN